MRFVRLLRAASGQVRRHPIHAFGVALLLALGLGPVMAITALMDRLLLHAAPYPEPQRVVAVWGRTAQGEQAQFCATGFLRTREASTAFGALSAHMPTDWALGRGADAVPVAVGRVTADYFRVLGLQPRMGRLGFTAEEDRFGAPGVVVLSSRAWRRHFGGEADAVGRTVVLNGRPHTVVGVLPPDYQNPTEWMAKAECFVPAGFKPEELASTGGSWEVLGRLKPGVSLEAANQGLNAIAASGVVPRRAGMFASPLAEELASSKRLVLGRFMAAAVMLLLLASVNAAHLILARSESRLGDRAVAVAMGASPTEMAGQSMAEALVLAVGGLVLGFPVALVIRTFLAAHLELQVLPPFSPLVFLAGAGAVLLILLLTSLLPAWAALRVSPMVVLRRETRGGVGGGRRWVLVLEMAMASLLLACASLMTRNLVAQMRLPTGIREPEKVLVAHLTLPQGAFATPEDRLGAYRALEGQLKGLPGVQTFALAQCGPFYLVNGTDDYAAPDGKKVRAHTHWMHGDLPGALGLVLLEGRLPRLGERTCLVSSNLAKRLWPEGGALGRALEERMVVGVVSPAVARRPQNGFSRQIWAPLDPSSPLLNVLLRGNGPASALEPVLREAVRRAGPDLQITKVEPLSVPIDQALAEPRKAAALLGVLALLALVLAAAGIYGVATQMAFSRRREFGVRMAMGATPGRLVGLVLRQGVRLAAIGLGFGLLGAAWVTQVFKGLLFGVQALDAVSFVLGGAVLLGTALLALLLPALRASRVSPSTALRSE